MPAKEVGGRIGLRCRELRIAAGTPWLSPHAGIPVETVLTVDAICGMMSVLGLQFC